jgi:ribosome-binding factor A
MSRRTHRVGDLVRGELSQLLLRDVHDPRIGMATIVEVDVSPDLRHAAVRVSVLGNEEQRLETLAALRHARGYLRSELARRLRLRVTPELVFELDRGAEYSQQISDLLGRLDRDDGNQDS